MNAKTLAKIIFYHNNVTKIYVFIIIQIVNSVTNTTLFFVKAVPKAFTLTQKIPVKVSTNPLRLFLHKFMINAKTTA